MSDDDSVKGEKRKAKWNEWNRVYLPFIMRWQTCTSAPTWNGKMHRRPIQYERETQSTTDIARKCRTNNIIISREFMILLINWMQLLSESATVEVVRQMQLRNVGKTNCAKRLLGLAPNEWSLSSGNLSHIGQANNNHIIMGGSMQCCRFPNWTFKQIESDCCNYNWK